MHPRSKTIPLAHIHSFTKQIVSSLCPESLTRSLSKSFSPVFCIHHIKHFLPSITLLHTHHFFFVSFSLYTFSWGCGSLRAPQKFFQTLFLYIHFFITYSFRNRFSQTWVSTCPMYALPVILISA